MSDHLILLYPLIDAATECEWLRVDADANVIGEQPHGAGSLADAAQAAAGARVVLVLPDNEVALSRPLLPPKSGKRLASLVPFALEDQVAAEIDTLHFAIGTQADDGAVDTAIIDREQLAGYLAALGEYGLTPVAAYGAPQLTPVTPGTITIVTDGPTMNVRRPDGVGFNTDVMLDRPVRESLTLSDTDPKACLVYTTATSYNARLSLLPEDTGLPDGAYYVGGAPQFLQYGPLQKYAEVALRDHPVSLLQGPFAPVSSGAAHWVRWRVPVFLVLGCVLLNVIVSTVDLIRAHRIEATLDPQLHAAYTQALPGMDPARVPAPRLLVESRVRRIAGAGQGGLIGALDSLGVAVIATPGITVKTINYHDGSLEAVLSAGDLASLNQVQQTVGPASRLAGVSTPDAQHAEGRLEITGTAP
jgi:general secretion pathway protein L